MTDHRGFTLIELLVVIFIISILAGVGLVSFSGAQKQARDTTRRSDLGQYRNALENYAANNNAFYILHASGIDADQMCGASELGSYMTSCLSDPKTGQEYRYVSNGDGTYPATGYILFATMETSTEKWYVCSNGKVGKAASPTLTTCGISSPF